MKTIHVICVPGIKTTEEIFRETCAETVCNQYQILSVAATAGLFDLFGSQLQCLLAIFQSCYRSTRLATHLVFQMIRDGNVDDVTVFKSRLTALYIISSFVRSLGLLSLLRLSDCRLHITGYVANRYKRTYHQPVDCKLAYILLGGSLVRKPYTGSFAKWFSPVVNLDCETKLSTQSHILENWRFPPSRLTVFYKFQLKYRKN